MIHATLKNLVAHKARLALTALSVVLGVAFVTGTLIYRDNTADAFDRIFADAYDGVDAVVSGDSPVRGESTLFPEALVDDVAAVPGVARAVPTLQDSGVQIIHDGEALAGGDAQLGGYLPADPEARLAVRLREGRAPTGPDETVIDASSAETAGIGVGDTVEIVTPASTANHYTVVGIAGFGEDDDLGGATLALFDLPTAQDLLGRPGSIDGAVVAAEPGVDVDDLIDRISTVLPDRAEVRTGAEAADEQAAELQEQLAFIYTFLLVFAFIALFVGTFIIFNTFRIVIAQRTRELALLRALGAGRGQVLRAVLLEASLVGVLASVAGIGAGVGVAVVLREGLAAVGIDLPADRLVLSRATVVIALVAGIGVTLLSALVPAFRGSRVAPLAAMRPEVAVGTPRGLRFRLAAGLGLAAVGGASIAIGLGLDGDAEVGGRLALVGPGVLGVVLGVQVLSAPAVGLITRVLGAPVARLSVVGRLAQRNAGRSPRRTAATAAAILIASALIALTNVMASSFQAAIDEVLDQGIDADYVATPVDTFSMGGFSTEVTDLVLGLDEFDSATRMQFAPVVVDGETEIVASIDDRFGDFLSLDDQVGDFDLTPDEVLIVSGPGTDPRPIGDTVTVETAQAETRTFTVGATATGQGLTGTFLSRPAYEDLLGSGVDQQVFLRLADGVDVDEAAAALGSIEDRFPTVAVQTMEDFRSGTADQITEMVGLVTALLGLTVVISLIGVANTMALAVHERTREIGLLRAIGLSRRDTRRMIGAEATVITLFGAVLGTGLGVFVAWALLRALRDLGFAEFVVPVPTLLGGIVVAAVLAVAFSAWPARKAARLDILRAIGGR